MKLSSLVKPGLLIFELVKIVIITSILILDENNKSIFLLVFFASQGAIFPIMALFLWLNTIRYKEYLPLYIAGKIITIVIITGWSVFSRQITMINEYLNVITLLSFDLFSLSAIIAIKKDVMESLNEPEEK